MSCNIASVFNLLFPLSPQYSSNVRKLFFAASVLGFAWRTHVKNSQLLSTLEAILSSPYVLSSVSIKIIKKKTSATENWTRVSCVTGRDNSHYTIADQLLLSLWVSLNDGSWRACAWVIYKSDCNSLFLNNFSHMKFNYHRNRSIHDRDSSSKRGRRRRRSRISSSSRSRSRSKGERSGGRGYGQHRASPQRYLQGLWKERTHTLQQGQAISQ